MGYTWLNELAQRLPWWEAKPLTSGNDSIVFSYVFGARQRESEHVQLVPVNSPHWGGAGSLPRNHTKFYEGRWLAKMVTSTLSSPSCRWWLATFATNYAPHLRSTMLWRFYPLCSAIVSGLKIVSWCHYVSFQRNYSAFCAHHLIAGGPINYYSSFLAQVIPAVSISYAVYENMRMRLGVYRWSRRPSSVSAPYLHNFRPLEIGRDLQAPNFYLFEPFVSTPSCPSCSIVQIL